MTAAGADLAISSLSWWQAWAMASVRLMVCWSIVPMLGKQLLPGLLRAGVVAALSLGFVPLMHAQLTEASTLDLMLMLVREVFVGLCMGIGIASVFWVIEWLAAVIDAQSGVQAGAMLNPLSASEEGVFAGLMYWAFIAYFFSVGGVNWMVDILAESYRVWPPGVWHPTLPLPGAEGAGAWWLGVFDRGMAAAVTLAAPVLVAMLMVELGLGLVGRFAPQLQVFFVAMPIKLMVALLVLGFQLAGIFATVGDLAGAARWVENMRGGLGG